MAQERKDNTIMIVGFDIDGKVTYVKDVDGNSVKGRKKEALAFEKVRDVLANRIIVTNPCVTYCTPTGY
jgi:hypothetical protein